MKAKVLTMLLFAFSVADMFGEEGIVYRNVQDAKKSGSAVDISAAIAKSEVKDTSVLEHFINPGGVYSFQYAPQKAEMGGTISLSIPTGERSLDLELVEAPAFFHDYEVVTDKGERFPANKGTRHYRGTLKDDPESLAALSFYGGEIAGFISAGGATYDVAYDKRLDMHLVYDSRNLRDKPRFACHTDDGDGLPYDPGVLMQAKSAGSGSSTTKVVRIYFETEYDVYQDKGSVPAVEAYVAGLFNQVAAIYQNEGIWVGISTLHVWTSTDPYTAASTPSLLAQFQAYRTSFNGDLGQLLTFRNVNGGIAAGFDGLCNSDISKRLSVTQIKNTYDNFPNYSPSVYFVAHELGHLFGSRHTHACVWNGNNTAIDGCYQTSGGCVQPPIPSNGGTIMSYCHLIDGVKINFSLGFGPQPGNVIRSSVANATCLSRITISGPDCFYSQGAYTLGNCPTGVTVQWSCGDSRTSIVSGQGTANVTLRTNVTSSNTSYIDVLTAEIKKNGQTVAELTFNYRAGFAITSIDMLDNYYASGVLVAKTTMGADPAVTADWTMPPGISIVDFPYLGDAFFIGRENCTVAISAAQGGYYNICATATNSEGCTTPQFCTTVYVAASRSFAVSTHPNPASDVLKLSIKMTDEARRQQLEALATGKSKAVKERTYTVQLFGTTGNLVQQAKATGDDIELSFDVSGLPNGTYFVVVKLDGSGEEPQRATVVVRR